MTKSNEENPVIIQGITQDGHPFRPSNWAERLTGVLSTFDDRRINYSPLLKPSKSEDGTTCVIIDPKLKKENPALFDYLMDFAKQNGLKVCR